MVAYGKRHETELEEIPESFYPFSGKNNIRDLHKIFFDDESYNKGHGQVYEYLGISPEKGAIVIVRPDQYVSAVISMDDYAQLGKFFDGFLISQDKQQAKL